MLTQYNDRRRKQRQEEERLKRQLLPWFEQREISPQTFDGLQPHNKRLLYKLVCERGYVTYLQRRNLWEALGQKETRGSPDHNGDQTDKELIKFFSPPSPGQTLRSWQRF